MAMQSNNMYSLIVLTLYTPSTQETGNPGYLGQPFKEMFLLQNKLEILMTIPDDRFKWCYCNSWPSYLWRIVSQCYMLFSVSYSPVQHHMLTIREIPLIEHHTKQLSSTMFNSKCTAIFSYTFDFFPNNINSTCSVYKLVTSHYPA